MAIRELKSGGKTRMGVFCLPVYCPSSSHTHRPWQAQLGPAAQRGLGRCEVRALSLTPESWRELRDVSSFTIIVHIVVLFDTDPHVVHACVKLSVRQE